MFGLLRFIAVFGFFGRSSVIRFCQHWTRTTRADALPNQHACPAFGSNHISEIGLLLSCDRHTTLHMQIAVWSTSTRAEYTVDTVRGTLLQNMVGFLSATKLHCNIQSSLKDKILHMLYTCTPPVNNCSNAHTFLPPLGSTLLAKW